MYCQNCGAKVSGNFCWQCGAKILSPTDIENAPAPIISPENKYEALVKRPDVRESIAKYAALSPHTLSAQDFLAVADLAFKPLMGGISYSKLTEVIVPIYSKLGIHTGKSTSRIFNAATEEIIIKTLCSLAKNGNPLKSVEQATNGIVLHAEIPSNFYTWAGDLLIVIEEQAATTKVDINANIKGQLYDWGKSNKVINKILADIDTIKI